MQDRSERSVLKIMAMVNALTATETGHLAPAFVSRSSYSILGGIVHAFSVTIRHPRGALVSAVLRAFRIRSTLVSKTSASATLSTLGSGVLGRWYSDSLGVLLERLYDDQSFCSIAHARLRKAEQGCGTPLAPLFF